MGWEGTDNEDVFNEPVYVEEFPFSREGRLFQRIEHELSLTQATLAVGSLVLEKQAIKDKKRARQGRRGASHPV
jgi:hypothetical protein